MTEFVYYKRRYRTITYMKSIAVHRGQTIEVLDLETNKTVRLGAFAHVTVISEKIENSKN